jgi:S-formylglutathione hydrolase FrmB
VNNLSTRFRQLCVIALTAGWCVATTVSGSTGTTKAAGFESLLVPSAAMGRDIPVAFLAGGPGNDWPTWGRQLGAMSGDLAANIR